VVTKLAEDVPEMAMLEVHGRAAWQEVAGRFEVSTRRFGDAIAKRARISTHRFLLSHRKFKR